MKKENFIEQAYLYLMNELDEHDKLMFEDTLLQKDELKKEFESIKETFELIEENKPSVADERLLTMARQSLMRQVRVASEKSTKFEEVIAALRNYVLANYKLAVGGVATFALGIVFGVWFLTSDVSKGLLNSEGQLSAEQIDNNGVKVSNIIISRSQSGEEQVEVIYESAKQSKYMGKASDPVIQKLLVASLLTESNPGLRLKSVNTIAKQVEENKSEADPKIKAALLASLKTDENPAVRKEALKVLPNFKFDNEIRDALLFVLSNDRNSGMRVAAINALTTLQQQGQTFDDKVKTVLSSKAENDNNNFVKFRAASMLKEDK